MLGQTSPIQPQSPVQKDQALYKVAKKLEATFLADMLQSAGLGETRGSFGGGAGESQFGSFMVHEQARQMVDAGGIGLAETLYHALKERADVEG